MTGKLYVDAIVTHHEPGIEGYQTINLMRLPVEEATKKAYLRTQILCELDALKRDFPEPSDHSKFVQWENDYFTAHEKKCGPLHDEYNCIKRPLEAYVVREGQYQLGQVLDEVPGNAVPVDEFFKQE